MRTTEEINSKIASLCYDIWQSREHSPFVWTKRAMIETLCWMLVKDPPSVKEIHEMGRLEFHRRQSNA